MIPRVFLEIYVNAFKTDWFVDPGNKLSIGKFCTERLWSLISNNTEGFEYNDVFLCKGYGVCWIDDGEDNSKGDIFLFKLPKISEVCKKSASGSNVISSDILFDEWFILNSKGYNPLDIIRL